MAKAKQMHSFPEYQLSSLTKKIKKSQTELFSGTLKKTLFLIIFLSGFYFRPANAQDWSFIKGYGNLPYLGSYGTQSMAAEKNNPGTRVEAVTWESNGKFYLFGGYGCAASSSGYLNDLWEYDPVTNNWRWLKGSKSPSQYGTFGTQGTADITNTPGGRRGAVGWESNGKLYLFGGLGYGTSGGAGNLNDLWEYDLATNMWRWLKGSTNTSQYGTYGVQGTADIANTPGIRQYAVSWESNGKLFLFGGVGYASNSNGYLNDLWEYDPTTNMWRWLKGSNVPTQTGTYGTQGMAAASNTPGGKRYAVSWESNGKLYLFGGEFINDLWEYDPTTNMWRWLKGSSTYNQYGTYGIQGTAAITNTPGARKGAISWESNDKLYLYAGYGYATNSYGFLNDLWEYDPVTNNWRWLKGSNGTNQFGIYGTQGAEDISNTPGGRQTAVSWENNGKLYLFGGEGLTTNASGYLNDLWEIDLSSNNWRWLKGSNNTIFTAIGIYGNQGIAAASNTPGARQSAVSWKCNGKLYLFGGNGSAGTGTGILNDLWEYDPATNNWRWLKGNTIPDQNGTYGTQGTAAAANMPGARQGAVGWESNGKLYLFGGSGYPASGNTVSNLNDLWEYDPATNNWRWVKGSSDIGQYGIYGTQGMATVSNTPGARRFAVSWESNGKLYLFGGHGYPATSNGYLNDLWEYDPTTNMWRWLKGSNARNPIGTYGTQGNASTANTPGGRWFAMSWKSNEKFYLFGGWGVSAGSEGYLNDLWEYDPATNNWRWLNGSNAPDQYGIYGSQKIASENNVPGSRYAAVNWESNGKLFLFGGNGNAESGFGYLNDLWEYDPVSNYWRWLNGSNIINQSGTYGTQGTPEVGNVPGSRYASVSWENNGIIYLFGGRGYGTNGDNNERGDLWSANLFNSPLPVTWLYFMGKPTDTGNKLTWATVSEKDSKTFEIERSFEGQNFQQIGKVEAAGNSLAQLDYRFIDNSAIVSGGETIYYRLKQVDLNGDYNYSSIVAINRNNFSKSVINALPNPFTSQLEILIGNTLGVVSVNLNTLEGKSIYLKEKVVNSGKVVLDDLPLLSSGMYLLEIMDSSGVTTLKVVKQ